MVSDSADGILQFHQFLLELTANDIYRLETLENMIIALEDRLFLDASPSGTGIKDIIKVRKDLLKSKRYYEQMEFLSDEMSAVDPAFSFIDKKFDRLMEFVLHLQSYIESVRDAYQAQIDIEQNQIMKFFTVVTTIFTPLTLITGWYGMNFSMPEYGWEHGYAYVSGLGLAVVLGLVLLFHKKKWF
jgi:magnesium transporter